MTTEYFASPSTDADASPSAQTSRGFFSGRIVIKGVQNLADARKLVDAGVDGLVLPNHGGRAIEILKSDIVRTMRLRAVASAIACAAVAPRLIEYLRKQVKFPDAYDAFQRRRIRTN